jgi:S-DNA-T family DNA segregation ATPase FtsK/SpoIIIE
VHDAERRQRIADLAGLGLLAVAVYLLYIVYLGWDGGRVGDWSKDALAYAVGAGAKLVPLALGGVGLGLILAPLMPSPRSVAVGTTALLAGLLLALAAQTGGLGPAGDRPGYWEPEFFEHHGGGIGELLYWSSTTLFQRLGAHILALLLVFSGMLLLSGRSLSTLLSAGGRGFDRARRGMGEFATAVRETGYTDPDLVETEPAETDRMYGPPEPVLLDEVGVAHGAGDSAPGPTEEDEQPGERAAEPPTADLEAVSFDEAVRVAEDAGPEQIEVARTPMGERRGEVTASEEIDYELPSRDVLEKGGDERSGPSTRDREAVGKSLLETLGHFGVEAQIVGTVIGPHVSRYELRLAPGTKVSKITQLKDDLAYALASTDIRILAPIPGKQAVGVEVPNQRRRLVRLGDIYGGRPGGSSPLAAWLGKDIAGHSVWTDLQKMPHVLIAGTTGSGKSGSINAVLSSILLHASPNEVRLVLVDPKRVELNHYESIPHLLTPVVTSPRLAANVLGNLIGEMESRYAIMGAARSRNLAELNGVRRRGGEPPLPHILCVIDELADLMMIAPAEVEDAVIRLAQKSRAVGIHLLLATQRPSTDIITGTIKVNIPARIAFAVSSQVDSRVILDQGGAEALLGQGDMLFRPAGTSKLQRIQGAYVSEAEIAKITKHWSAQGEPEFEQELLEAREGGPADADDGDFSPDQDELLEQAAAQVVESGTASVSMIQRRLRVGYTRAGRLIDMLERRGIISGYEGSKPRQVLATAADLPRLLGGDQHTGDEDDDRRDEGQTGDLEAVPAGD